MLTKKSIPVYAHVSLYENIEDNLNSIFQYEIDIKEIITNNAQMKSRLEEIVRDHSVDYKYIALKAKYQYMILILNENGQLVGAVKAPYLQ